MTYLTLDAQNSAVFDETATPAAIDITTTLDDDIIVVCVVNEFNGGDHPAVSSIVSSPALTWNERATIPANFACSTDIWWSHAATAEAYAITITMNEAVDGAGIALFALNGTTSLTAPFDGNASMPGHSSPGDNTTSIANLSTNSSSGFLIGLRGTNRNAADTMPAGWVDTGTWSTSGTTFFRGNFGLQAYGSPLSSKTIKVVNTGVVNDLVVDAIPGTFPPGPPAKPGGGSGFKWWWREKSRLLLPERGLIIPAYARVAQWT